MSFVENKKLEIYPNKFMYQGGVAQLVEQAVHIRCVRGSSPCTAKIENFGILKYSKHALKGMFTVEAG